MSTIGEEEIVNSLVSEVIALYTQIGSRYSTYYEVEGASILREIRECIKKCVICHLNAFLGSVPLILSPNSA